MVDREVGKSTGKKTDIEGEDIFVDRLLLRHDCVVVSALYQIKRAVGIKAYVEMIGF
jgi:hypothetical protein